MSTAEYIQKRIRLQREKANAERSVIYHLDRRILCKNGDEIEILRRHEKMIAARLRLNRACQALAALDAEYAPVSRPSSPEGR